MKSWPSVVEKVFKYALAAWALYLSAKYRVSVDKFVGETAEFRKTVSTFNASMGLPVPSRGVATQQPKEKQ